MNATFTHGHAVIIGVGGDLPHTIDDAVGLAALLGDAGRCAYPPAQVRLLTGPQADRPAILAALDSLAAATTPDSTVIVYFSGHGYRVTASTGAGYYLLPHGYDVSRLYQTAVSGAELTQRLAALPAQKAAAAVGLLPCRRVERPERRRRGCRQSAPAGRGAGVVAAGPRPRGHCLVAGRRVVVCRETATARLRWR
jgi:hypothetical protein